MQGKKNDTSVLKKLHLKYAPPTPNTKKILDPDRVSCLSHVEGKKYNQFWTDAENRPREDFPSRFVRPVFQTC